MLWWKDVKKDTLKIYRDVITSAYEGLMLSLLLLHFCLFFRQNEITCSCSNTFAETYKVIKKIEKFLERDVYLLASALQRSTLFWSKLYCSSNGLT